MRESSHMVSVALCTYNGEKYIEEQLESILTQTQFVDEIIIGDDASKDNTLAIVRKLLESGTINYKVIEHRKNIGVAANFMETIRACTGDIVITCDQDDIWYKNKVEALLKEFEDEEVSLVFSDADLVDSVGKKIGVRLWKRLEITQEVIEKEYFAMLLRSNIVTGAAMAFRKEIISEIGNVPKGHLHDEWIAINAICYGKVKGISEPLIGYRQHENNVIGAPKKNLLKKVIGYLRTFESVAEYRKWKQRFYINFYENAKCDLSQEYLALLNSCIAFWDEQCEMENLTLSKRLGKIMHLYKEGGYKRYFAGFKSVVRDVVWSVMK